MDFGGLQHWASTGLTREELEAALGASEEGQRVAAVRALYAELLTRDPLVSDNTGLRAWGGSGLNLGEVRARLETSAEGQRVTAVRSLYRELLGSDNAGLRYWVEPLLSTGDVRQAILEIVPYHRPSRSL